MSRRRGAITIGTKTPEIRSARRCTSALPFCASSTSRAICASWVSDADAGGAHDEPAPGVDGRSDDGVAGADLDGHGLAGEHGGVDGGAALLDDAVGGDLLAGAHDEEVTDGELVGGDAHLGCRRARTATSLAPSSSSARSAAPARRLARASK